LTREADDSGDSEMKMNNCHVRKEVKARATESQGVSASWFQTAETRLGYRKERIPICDCQRGVGWCTCWLSKIFCLIDVRENSSFNNKSLIALESIGGGGAKTVATPVDNSVYNWFRYGGGYGD